MKREEYRKRLYEIYESRPRPVRAEVTREAIERQFPVWESRFRRHLPRDLSTPVIDVGCGSGGFVHYLRRVGYSDVRGVDISGEQVAAARSLGIAGVTREDIREHLAAHPAAYGAVIARDLIEHFTREEVIDLLILAHRSLIPGGTLLIQTVNLESPFSLRYRWGDLTHESGFTSYSLEAALLLAGFQGAASYSAPPVFRYSLKSAVRTIFWKGIEGLWRFTLMVESGQGRGIFTANLVTAARR
ncbi:MAG: class I SAM-dependent methyltransferase [Candidatus Erginobacter occultus]|nr:class I SAM-dependent methyltransferase [Candidatus Erginobacter occultus]